MSEAVTLILSVDRDDDIGYKGHIESPRIGRSDCLSAANTLALVDPEDSDLNAIFQAIKMYDELKARGEPVEIALLAGNHGDMLAGDRRIAQDLDQVVRTTGATSCILVTDGAEDEYVLPIIESRLPVHSVRRVVVTQIPNLESTYYIVKRLFDDPKIGRVTLVPLGLAMLLYALAYLIGYPEGATIIVFGIVGVYMLFKGFGIDETLGYMVGSLHLSLRHGKFSFVTYVVGILLAVVGVIIGLTHILLYYPSQESLGVFLNVVTFLYGSAGWFLASAFLVSVGRIVDTQFNEPENLTRVVVLPFFAVAIGIIVYGASVYTLSISELADFPFTAQTGLEFLSYTLAGGLGCAFLGAFVQSAVRRWQAQRSLIGAEEIG